MLILGYQLIVNIRCHLSSRRKFQDSRGKTFSLNDEFLGSNSIVCLDPDEIDS